MHTTNQRKKVVPCQIRTGGLGISPSFRSHRNYETHVITDYTNETIADSMEILWLTGVCKPVCGWFGGAFFVPAFSEANPILGVG